jgi:hypothetical protein
MIPVTWSQASVSVNSLSVAQSVTLVFLVQAIWMPTVYLGAAKVSELGPLPVREAPGPKEAYFIPFLHLAIIREVQAQYGEFS